MSGAASLENILMSQSRPDDGIWDDLALWVAGPYRKGVVGRGEAEDYLLLTGCTPFVRGCGGGGGVRD